MSFGTHPQVMNRHGTLGLGNIFCDGCEMNTGLGDAGAQSWLVGELVGNGVVLRHLVCMARCRPGKSRIPTKFMEVLCSTLAVRSVEQVFLASIGMVLGGGMQSAGGNNKDY